MGVPVGQTIEGKNFFHGQLYGSCVVNKSGEYLGRILSEEHCIINPTNISRCDQEFQAFLPKDNDIDDIGRN